ncbi:MAG: hypothetical protein FWD77_08020 [Betaproteobacteria bacterium]|nr:hypothetical protein [Betaproteobacteria bacterium]
MNLNRLYFSLGLLFAAKCAIAAPSVAGLAPYERPTDAPVISADAPLSDAQKEHFFHGVEKPLPPSVESVAQPGNWYTPFNRPGMHGYYDIRGWHKKP